MFTRAITSRVLVCVTRDTKPSWPNPCEIATRVTTHATPANATEKGELTADGGSPTASRHPSGPSRALICRHFVCILSTARHVQLKVSTIDSASGRRVADLTYCPSTTRSIRNASDEPRTGLKSAALVE
jgi:hypothetical protein